MITSGFAAVRDLDRVELSVSPAFVVPSEEGSKAGRALIKSWRCTLHTNGQPQQQSCSRTAGWLIGGPGDYGVFVSIWRRGDKVPAVYGQRLHVTGDELRVETRLLFPEMDGCGDGSPFGPPGKAAVGLSDFTLQRIFPAPADLLLRRAWAPRPDESPRYEIKNRGKLKWLGTSWDANFFGHVESFVGGAWKPYERGGMCGNVGYGLRLIAGSTVESIEGYFIGNPKPLAPGRYRYVVQVTRDEQATESHPCNFSVAGAPFIRAWDAFELIDEFSIGPQAGDNKDSRASGQSGRGEPARTGSTVR